MSQVDEILNSLEVSTHEHDVIDTDKTFTIDPFTRNIIADSGQKTIIIQGDHNSERFTFTMPRYIEGHDMALCNLIYVPYINSEPEGRNARFKTGVYPVNDLTIVPDKDKVTFSWLISGNATKYEGNTTFSVLFSCVTGKRVDYRWSTNFYEELYVLKSLDSELSFENEYVEVIEAWKEAVKAEFAEFIDIKVREYVAVAKDELNVSLTDYLNGHVETFNNKINAFDEILRTEIAKMDNDIDVLKSRMDTFTSLPEGSTAGDAELADIRVDFEGSIHGSAGTASRNSSKILDNVKQMTYGHFESVEGVVHNDVVYNVESKTEQAISGGYYAEFNVSDEVMLLISGFSWSSFSIFPLGAFYDAEGNLLKKVGHTESNTHDKVLCYVPIGATSLIINGKKWYEPEVEKFVSGNLEGDISEIQKTLSSQILSSKMKSYEEIGIEAISIELTENNTELIAEQMYKTEGDLTTGVLSGSTYDTLIYPVGTFVSFSISKYNAGVYGGAFLDDNKKWISSFKTDYPNNLEEKIVPENAHYIAITVNSTSRYKTIIGFRKTYELSGLRINNKNVINNWTNKKIVWIGTSVPFGQYATKSYPHEVSKHLGFELVNCSAPGLAIHTGNNNTVMKYGSLALSKAEYEAINWTIPNEPVAYVPGGSYNDYYRTYENIFCEENADADLYVFDVVPNNSNFDTSDWNMFDHKNWCYTDGSSFEDHRTTFLGALLFLMDKMYTLNENARMIFVLGSGFSYWEGKSAFEAIVSKWNIPIIDLWSKINTSPKSINKIFSENGTNGHPSTYAHELMGKMLSHDLNGVC